MISEFPPEAPTERHWAFNEEVNQNHMLAILADQNLITATLGWKGSS
jgi:hypothetical protein